MAGNAKFFPAALSLKGELCKLGFRWLREIGLPGMGRDFIRYNRLQTGGGDRGNKGKWGGSLCKCCRSSEKSKINQIVRDKYQ